MDIVAAYEQVETYRGAAALCGTTHKTVKRVIERRRAGEAFDAPRRELPNNTDAVTTVIAEKVRATDGRIWAKRLLPLARTAGYTGSARNFRSAVAEAKKDWRRRRRVYRAWQPKPGEHLVIDWATEGGWQIFCAVAPWSRWRFEAHGHRPEGGHHHGPARRVLRGARRCHPGGAGRPHGLPQGRGGRRGGADGGLCPLRQPLRLVPKELVGDSAQVVSAGEEIHVHHGEGVVAIHDVVAPGECSIKDEHYGGPRRSPARGVRPRSGAERAFLALGPGAESFLRAAAASRRRGGERRWSAPFERATKFRRFRVADVRSARRSRARALDSSRAASNVRIPWGEGPPRMVSRQRGDRQRGRSGLGAHSRRSGAMRAG